MVTNFKVTINALLGVLFLTMVIFSPNVFDFAYFVLLFVYLWKFEWF